MKKILFFIPNLCGGGAEKVLINLCNNLIDKYDITLLTIFNEGIYIDKLDKRIHYMSIHNHKITGIRLILKLIPNKLLSKIYIKGKYDIVISYLEGITTKILSSFKNSQYKIAWIHSKISKSDIKKVYLSKKQFEKTYNNYNKIIFVSKETKMNFINLVNNLDLHIDLKKCKVVNNINETEKIKIMSHESVEVNFDKSKINCVVVGKIAKSKGVFRLIDIFENKNLKDKFNVYFVGDGPEMEEAKKQVKEKELENCFYFLGFEKNPYKIMQKVDLVVCPSYTEGLSTVITEALIIGKAILTTDCGGMKELLGNSEFGYVVENSNLGLKRGFEFYSDVKNIQLYEKKSKERAKMYEKKKVLNDTIKELEEWENN